MVNINRRQFVILGGVTAAAAATAGLAGCSSGSTGSSSSASSAASSAAATDTDLISMSWDDIKAQAKGQTVSFLAWGSGGADAFVQKYWNKLADDMKEKYDITMSYAEDTAAEEQKIVTDIENGADATYDMFWGLGSTVAAARKAGVFGNWVSTLPNAKYLDMDNAFNTFDGTQSTENEESGFQGLNPSLVYSKDAWSSEIAYDATQGDVKGLFHNFTELAEWVKINPGKFTYMDLTGKGAFHGLSFAKAILAELKDDGKGGWTTVYDEADSADARRKKINQNIEDWYTWATSGSASEEAFIERASYLWAYLNEIAPNLMQGDAGAMYVPTAPDMMSYVKSGDLAVTFTTCTQVSNRVESAPDSYMANPAIYMLDTSTGSWDYVVITGNSKNKAGALVVANEMLDPENQLYAFQTTGNGYNVSYDKLDSSMQGKFDAAVKDMGALTSSTEAIAKNSYTDKFGPVAKWIASGWAQKVNAK